MANTGLVVRAARLGVARRCDCVHTPGSEGWRVASSSSTASEHDRWHRWPSRKRMRVCVRVHVCVLCA